MKNRKLWIALGLGVLLISVPVVGQALADGYGQDIWSNLWQLLINEVAEATGLTVDEVNQALEQGQSLAEIAEAHGADPDEIVAAVVERAGAVIDQAVEAGLMDADQAELARAMLENRIDMMMLTRWVSYSDQYGPGMWGGIWAEQLEDMPEELQEMMGNVWVTPFGRYRGWFGGWMPFGGHGRGWSLHGMGYGGWGCPWGWFHWDEH